MIDDISIEMEARDPAVNRMRSWRVEAGPDLFGIWCANVHFGRIGTLGRTVTCSFESEAAARAFVRTGIRRRGTARRRIGVAYLLVEASLEARQLLEEMSVQ